MSDRTRVARWFRPSIRTECACWTWCSSIFSWLPRDNSLERHLKLIVMNYQCVEERGTGTEGRGVKMTRVKDCFKVTSGIIVVLANRV